MVALLHHEASVRLGAFPASPGLFLLAPCMYAFRGVSLMTQSAQGRCVLAGQRGRHVACTLPPRCPPC
jgi:hypothetical protein